MNISVCSHGSAEVILGIALYHFNVRMLNNAIQMKIVVVRKEHTLNGTSIFKN